MYAISKSIFGTRTKIQKGNIVLCFKPYHALLPRKESAPARNAYPSKSCIRRSYEPSVSNDCAPVALRPPRDMYIQVAVAQRRGAVKA